MFGSVGFGELLLIGVVALIVFGPNRLPELARKAGQLLAQARRATQEFTDALDAEYDGATSPMRDLRAEYESTKRQITDATAKLVDRVTSDEPPPPAVPGGEDPSDADEPGPEPRQRAGDDRPPGDGLAT
jgi:sec-independent protein translocase protein TatB